MRHFGLKLDTCLITSGIIPATVEKERNVPLERSIWI